MKKLLIFIFLVLIIIGVIFLKRDKRENIDIPILLYHDFVVMVPDEDPDDFNYINTPLSFEENIKTLLDNDYTFLSFKDLNDAYNGKKELPDKPILITFDDGYYSNYRYIFPILEKYNVKASIFIVTDNIGKMIDGKKYLSWRQCEIMYESGLVEIFSHSTKHVFYDRLPVRELKDDVNESYQEIEKHLGKQDLKVFCLSLWCLYKRKCFCFKIKWCGYAGV